MANASLLPTQGQKLRPGAALHRSKSLKARKHTEAPTARSDLTFLWEARPAANAGASLPPNHHYSVDPTRCCW